MFLAPPGQPQSSFHCPFSSPSTHGLQCVKSKKKNHEAPKYVIFSILSLQSLLYSSGPTLTFCCLPAASPTKFRTHNSSNKGHIPFHGSLLASHCLKLMQMMFRSPAPTPKRHTTFPVKKLNWSGTLKEAIPQLWEWWVGTTWSDVTNWYSRLHTEGMILRAQSLIYCTSFR